jgi:hypothetical protein
MFDQFAIMGFVITIVQIIKLQFQFFTTPIGKKWLVLLVIFMSGALNVVNALAFGDITTALAFKEGLNSGLVATGMYAAGTTILSKDKK